MKRLHNTLIVAAAVLAMVACKKESTDKKADDKDTKTTPATDPAPNTDGKVDDKKDKPNATAGFGDAVGKYKVDPVHAAVNFKIAHMNVSHTLGRFNKVTGELNLAASPSASSVSISVDAGSIFTADKKRDQHLEGPDFLNVAQFPTIDFKSTKIEAAADKRYRVTGDLKLHGVTKSVVAEFEHVGSGPNMMDKKLFLVGFTGTLNLKRTDFGMDKMVGPAGDDIELTIAVRSDQAVRPSLDPIETIAIVVVVPGLIALAVSFVGRRHAMTGAIAVSCGAFVATWLLLGRPSMWPLDVTDRFAHVVICGLVAALIGTIMGKRARWLALAIAGAAVAAMIIGPLLSHRFSGALGPLALIGVAAAITVVGLSIEATSSNTDRIATIPLLVLLSGASAAAGISGSLTLALLGGIVATALGGTWLLTIRTDRAWLTTIAPIVACALIALLALSSFYSSMRAITALALVAAPIASAIAAKTLSGVKARWAPLVCTVVLVGIALGPPLFAGEASTSDTGDDDYGYE